jgi:hypothetical protein
LVGHKPAGPAPLVLKFSAGGPGAPRSWAGAGGGGELEVLCCDTSFSDPRAPDMRGAAAFAVTLHFPAPPLAPSPPQLAPVAALPVREPALAEAAVGCAAGGGAAGAAVAAGTVTASVASVSGCLPGGERLLTSDVTGDALAGRRSRGGWWVVGRRDSAHGPGARESPGATSPLHSSPGDFADPSGCYLLARTTGHTVDLRWESGDDVQRELGRHWAATLTTAAK